jgi:hypothetical protein
MTDLAAMHGLSRERVAALLGAPVPPPPAKKRARDGKPRGRRRLNEAELALLEQGTQLVIDGLTYREAAAKVGIKWSSLWSYGHERVGRRLA